MPYTRPSSRCVKLVAGAAAGARWLCGLALALTIEDLLMLRSEMPDGVRLLVGAAAVLALALALSSALRRACRRHAAPLAAAALVAVLAAVPAWTTFRFADRTGTLTEEYTAHGTRPASSPAAGAGSTSTAATAPSPSSAAR
jgi:hypothetical protein